MYTFYGKFYVAVHFAKQGMVFTHAYVVACMKLGAALANDDGTGRNQLVAVGFHAQAFGL